MLYQIKQGFGISTIRYFLFNMWPVNVIEITTFNNEYSLKLQSGTQREKELIILAWKVKASTV